MVLATWPPVNCPRLTSYVLVITRVLRTASCGTEPEPKLRPSRVIWFWFWGCPATEKLAGVESVAIVPTTPGESVATVFKSPLSTGSRSSCAELRLRSVLPAVGRSCVLSRALVARTVTAASTCALRVRRTLVTSRSSSAWRATFAVYGAKPMNVTRIR